MYGRRVPRLLYHFPLLRLNCGIPGPINPHNGLIVYYIWLCEQKLSLHSCEFPYVMFACCFCLCLCVFRIHLMNSVTSQSLFWA